MEMTSAGYALICREFTAGGARRDMIVGAAETTGGLAGPFAAAARLQHADVFARRTLMRHGLGCPVEWSSRMVTVAGRARMTQADDVWCPQRMLLSAPLLARWPADEAEDTVRHEAAHFLAPALSRAHGREWMAACAVTGARPEACYAEELQPEDLRPAKRGPMPLVWAGICPAGHVVRRARQPKKRVSCGRCWPTWNAAHALEWMRVQPS